MLRRRTHPLGFQNDLNTDCQWLLTVPNPRNLYCSLQLGRFFVCLFSPEQCPNPCTCHLYISCYLLPAPHVWSSLVLLSLVTTSYSLGCRQQSCSTLQQCPRGHQTSRWACQACLGSIHTRFESPSLNISSLFITAAPQSFNASGKGELVLQE